MPNLSKLNSFTGGAYGEKATLVLPVGPTIEEIFLETNLSPAQIVRVSVTLNGDEIYILSGEELRMLEAYKGLPTQDGWFVIPFVDITGKTKNGVRYTGLVTEMGDNITLDVEIKDNPTSNAPNVKIQAHATLAPPQPARVLVPRIRKQTMQATAAGDNEFLNLTSGQNVFVRRMHFQSDNVNGLKIYRDSIKVHESSRQLATYQAKRNDKKWQSNNYHFDPIQRGFFINEIFETAHASELKFTVQTSAPCGTIPILVESIEVVRPEFIQA